MKLYINASDHIYQVHGQMKASCTLVELFVNCHIDTSMEKLDFHVMKLQSANVIFGYLWFSNEIPSCSLIELITQSHFNLTGIRILFNVQIFLVIYLCLIDPTPQFYFFDIDATQLLHHKP